MKDIFISHSSKDVQYAKELYKKYEAKGYTCWASFDFESINPGDDYTEKIPAAINSCKVFLLLVSFNALESGQVKNEIIIANNRKKYGLKLLGTILDDNIDVESLSGGVEYVFAASQLGYWSDPSYQTALEKVIHESIVPQKKHIDVHIETHVPEADFFVGRETELKKIFNLLTENRKVCLYGMGGIGKTAIVKDLCRKAYLEKKYENVVYLPVSNGLLRALADDRNLQIQTEGIAEVKKQSDYTLGYFKLEALESGVHGKTLMVIDNLESEQDPLFSRIVSLPFDMVICCRNLAMRKYTNASYCINEIKNENVVRKIFEKHYGRLLTEKESGDAERLFHSVRNHTLTIGLLGKQLKYYGFTPAEYLTEDGVLSRPNLKTFKNNHENGFYERLHELFDARSLSEDEISVMKSMCLTPETGVPGYIIEELSGQECIEEIQVLKGKGWIQQDEKTRNVFLHPVVKEIVLDELGVTLEDKEIQIFTSNLIESINNSWDKSEEELLPYKDLALAYYFRFQTPSIARFNQYLTLAKYFWVVNCPDIGIEIMDKVKMLFIKPDGSHLNTSQEAEALLQIGFIYQGKGEYKKAEDNLNLATRIFGNRYGAALSHLAQAKMSIKKEPIETIEPLLLESLTIRKNFWSGTISEAAAYHLYAKVLSEYKYKLEDALDYEKQADRFFSSKQPGSRNESSSKYILGWLYIQVSDGDEELFEYGVSLLEKAKTIRIKNVGRYGIWMEDVYRKLGIAYFMKKDFKQAAFHFEELLEVAKGKYTNDKSNPTFIEAHKYLAQIYKELGDEEKVAHSRKYLRIYG